MNEDNYSKAYAEILHLLKGFSKEEIDKWDSTDYNWAYDNIIQDNKEEDDKRKEEQEIRRRKRWSFF